MKTKYKAIILDLGGVISVSKRNGSETKVHEIVAKKLGLSVDLYLDSIDEIYADAISGKVSRSYALRTMAKNLNTTPERLKKIYILAYRKNFRRDNSISNLALKLKKSGYKIGIISDIWSVAKEALIDKSYYKNFDDVTTSCDVGSRKTKTKIFKVALRKLKVSPHETFFTDNQKWNLIAPRKLGITAVQYKNKRCLVKELKRLKII